MSGAPKVRAMEIIGELEPEPRALRRHGGLLGSDGAMDMCITISGVMLADGRAYVQSGAGIVADSDPAKEFEECRHKAAALQKALGLAAGMNAPEGAGESASQSEPTAAEGEDGSRRDADSPAQREGGLL